MLLNDETICETETADCLHGQFRYPICSIIYNNHLIAKTELISQAEFIN